MTLVWTTTVSKTYDWQVVHSETSWGGSKYDSTEHGGQFVMTSGHSVTQMLCAGEWNSCLFSLVC